MTTACWRPSKIWWRICFNPLDIVAVVTFPIRPQKLARATMASIENHPMRSKNLASGVLSGNFNYGRWPVLCLKAVLLGLLLLGISSPYFAAEARIYSWRDAEGVLHFSDVPPGEADGVRVIDAAPADLHAPKNRELSPGESHDLPASPAPISENSFTHGLLWQVTHPQGAVNHILGTIHSDDPRVLALPPAVAAALDGARRFMMEVVMTPEALVTMAQRITLTKGDLKSILGSALFDRTAEALAERGMPPQMVRRLKPWAAAMMLSMPATQTGRYLDLELYQRALAGEKAVHGLERVDIFDGLSRQDQVAYLKQALHLLPRMPAILEQMITLYVAGELRGLAALAHTWVAPGSSGALPGAPQLMERLNDHRNVRMVARMETHLKSGGTFVAVGALHLAGPKGILNLLAQKGYRVAAVANQ